MTLKQKLQLLPMTEEALYHLAPLPPSQSLDSRHTPCHGFAHMPSMFSPQVLSTGQVLCLECTLPVLPRSALS